MFHAVRLLAIWRAVAESPAGRQPEVHDRLLTDLLRLSQELPSELVDLRKLIADMYRLDRAGKKLIDDMYDRDGTRQKVDAKSLIASGESWKNYRKMLEEQFPLKESPTIGRGLGNADFCPAD